MDLRPLNSITLPVRGSTLIIMYFIRTRSTETTTHANIYIYIFIMGHIVISPVSALPRTALVDPRERIRYI